MMALTDHFTLSSINILTLHQVNLSNYATQIIINLSVMKKNILFGIIISLLNLGAFSQVTVDTVTVKNPNQGFEALLVEKSVPSALAISNDPNLTEAHVVYRIFLDMEKGYNMLGCSGLDYENPPVNMLIESSAPFYNPDNTGETGMDVNMGFWSLMPQLEFDTYVADGRVGNDSIGVLKSLDPDGTGYITITSETTPVTNLVLGQPMPILTDSDTMLIDGYNDGWGVGKVVGPDTTTNMVFVAQFTTTGDLKMKLHFSLQNQFGQKRVTKNVVYGFDPNPSIEITGPVPGSFIQPRSEIGLAAVIVDYDGQIDSAQFYINDVFIGKDTLKPFTDEFKVNWTDVTLGEKTMKVIAYDNDGNSTTEISTFTVTEPLAPEIEIVSPDNNAEVMVNSVTEIRFLTEDLDGSIINVIISIDGEESGISYTEGEESTYEWIPSETGIYTIVLTAMDNDSTTTSDSRTYTVVEETININAHGSAKNEYLVYPNPFKHRLIVEFSDAKVGELYQIEVFDITGNIIMSSNVLPLASEHAEDLDVNNLPNGLYILSITDNSGFRKVIRISKN